MPRLILCEANLAVLGTLSDSTLQAVDKRIAAVGNLGPVGDKLRKLDISKNECDSLAGIRGPCISWFQANDNRLRGQALVDVNALPSLTFLGLSNNRIATIPVSALSAHSSCLRAILLNGNKLVRLEHLSHLSALTTLVVSHNRLEDVSAVTALTALQKLSAGHNRIASIPASIGCLGKLAELRLNDNMLTAIPPELALCTGLRLIDLGNNALPDWESIGCLGKLKRLVNLTLRGNPLTPEASASTERLQAYAATVRALCANLHVLDNRRIELLSALPMSEQVAVGAVERHAASVNPVPPDIQALKPKVRDPAEQKKTQADPILSTQAECNSSVVSKKRRRHVGATGSPVAATDGSTKPSRPRTHTEPARSEQGVGFEGAPLRMPLPVAAAASPDVPVPFLVTQIRRRAVPTAAEPEAAVEIIKDVAAGLISGSIASRTVVSGWD
jgi:hypothetical protein